MAEQFKNLFSPLKVGTMQLRNRICSLPHGANFPEQKIQGLDIGMPGPKHAAYWEERARGGAAWIGTQASFVSLDPTQNHFKYKEFSGFLKAAYRGHSPAWRLLHYSGAPQWSSEGRSAE